jgi:hypothetical protein
LLRVRRLIRGLRSILVQTALFFGLWVLFSEKRERADLLAGAAAALLGTAASRVVARHGLGRLILRPRWLAEAWHLPGMVATGIADIFGVLARQAFRPRPAASVMASVPFDPTGSRDELATRSALAVAYVTTSPNFIVLDIVNVAGDERSAEMRYHQIDPTDIPAVARHLGARP